MSRFPHAAKLTAALRDQRQVMLSVLPGLALILIHMTAVDLPRADIVDALDSDHYRIQWIHGASILGTAIGMALTTFLGGRFGLRRSYVLALVLFAIASGMCATVDTVFSMTPLRFAQGLGMGLAISSGMVIVWRAFPVHRELGMALYGMAVFVPAVAGVMIGGWLTAWISWRLVFLVNLPFGLIVAIAAWWLLPNDQPAPADSRTARLDVVGLCLVAACIVTLSVVFDLGQYWGWFASPYFVPWFLGAAASVIACAAWGLLAAAPLTNLRALTMRNFALGLGIKIVYSINLFLLLSLLANYMIDLRGYQWHQGAAVVAPALVSMVLSLAIGELLGRDANRKLRMFGGLAIMAVATWQFSAVDVYTAKTWQAAVLALWGLGAGFVCGPALLTTFEGLSLEQTLATAGVFNIMRYLPSYFAGGLLIALLVQHSDENFDWLRLNIRTERPIVAESLRDARAHMISKGSPHDLAHRQAQGMLTQWVHDNSRAYSFRDIFQVLALAPCIGMLLVLAVRIPSLERQQRPAPQRGQIDGRLPPAGSATAN